MKKYISYSEMRLWDLNQEEYIRRYIKGEEQEPNKEMILGTIIHRTLEDPRYEFQKAMLDAGFNRRKIKTVRTLIDKMVPKLPPEREVKIGAQMAGDIELFSVFDGFDPEQRILYEYKTSENEIWNQRIVNYHQQLDFYAMVYYLKFHSFFREIRLFFLNTKSGNVKTFKTARSIRDINMASYRVQKFYQQMIDRGLWNKRLSREDKALLNNGKLLI